MRNKIHALKGQLSSHLHIARQIYQDFRVYDLGSYALNRLTPKQGFQAQKNLAYGIKARQRFDLFLSDTPLPQRPLIVFVHGGAWMHGDKKDYHFIGEAFAKDGYDVVVMNYHLAPTHIFPKSVDDLHVLLDFLMHNQTKLNVSANNIVLIGHSAGAFNVLSALYYPDAQVNIQDKIRAVIGIAGPYHFDYKDDPLCADAFDQSVPYQQVMPYYYVKANTVKHYLIMAEKDTIVGEFNSRDLDRKLKEVGNHSQVITVPKLGHITIVGSLSSLFSSFFRTKSAVLNALDEVFKS